MVGDDPRHVTGWSLFWDSVWRLPGLAVSLVMLVCAPVVIFFFADETARTMEAVLTAVLVVVSIAIVALVRALRSAARRIDSLQGLAADPVVRKAKVHRDSLILLVSSGRYLTVNTQVAVLFFDNEVELVATTGIVQTINANGYPQVVVAEDDTDDESIVSLLKEGKLPNFPLSVKPRATVLQ